MKRHAQLPVEVVLCPVHLCVIDTQGTSVIRVVATLGITLPPWHMDGKKLCPDACSWVLHIRVSKVATGMTLPASLQQHLVCKPERLQSRGDFVLVACILVVAVVFLLLQFALHVQKPI
jgi:hypothetical protein